MLYTGKGDGGTTKVFGCDQQRISKSSVLPEALGALDELNAFLGFVKMRVPRPARDKRAYAQIAFVLRDIQEELFIVQAEVAGADKCLKEGAAEDIGKIVDAIEKEIPRVEGFCIAGGTELSALLDVARTLARRAERRVIAVAEAGLRDIAPPTRAYLNRLSSLLFALARLANHQAGVKEENPRY